MKQLNKKDSERRDQFVSDLRDAEARLQSAVDRFNEQLVSLEETVQEAVNDLNEKLREAGEFCEGIAADAQSFYDDRSEKWQEGDAGTQHYDWINEWSNINTDEIDIEFPASIEMIDRLPSDDLESLPESP